MPNSTRYSYAAQPKAISRSSHSVKQILRTGNAEKLEKLIVAGHGYKLIGEFSSDPKIRSLLKAVPFYLARIDMVHEAATKGQLKDVQVLTKLRTPVFSVLKAKPENLINSIDSAGAGLLHKAVFYDHIDLVRWLAENYPKSVHVRDKLGRIPLHYVRATTQPDRIWQILVAAGSEVDVEDNNGRTPSYYLDSGAQIHLPDRIRRERPHNEAYSAAEMSNIRKWIREQDIDRLQQVIWEGHGEKLKTQTSNKQLMKRFLHGIPYIMAVVQEIHKAATQNDVNKLTKYCRKPVPAIILDSKDKNGATALHKACGLGHEEVVDFILSKYPEAIFASDNCGRTAAHYAAAFQRERIYEKLLLAGAPENIVEKNGKTAKSYKLEAAAIDESVLHEIPSSPRGGINNVYPSSFDWTILSNTTHQKVADKVITDDAEIVHLSLDVVEKGEDVQNDAANHVPDEDRPPETLSREGEPTQIEDVADTVSETTIECDTLMNHHQDADETNLKSQQDEESSSGRTDAHEQYDTLMNHHQEDETSLKSPQDTENSNSTGIRTDDAHEPTVISSLPATVNNRTTSELNVDDIVKSKNLEDLGRVILDGYGEQLVGAKSDDEQIQEFLNHLPIYLKKIELIHYCCQLGNLEELQKYLDRRKLAMARESRTTLYLTPLHLATVHNRKSIVRYLAGRFPETLRMVDRLGRTALHFAAIHPDGKYVYNALLTLGANKSDRDEDGFTAEYYYENFSRARYEQLVSNVIAKEPGVKSWKNENYNSNASTTTTTTTSTTALLNEFTTLGKSESDYISAVLGDALKTGLSAIIRTRPSEPIKFLADYLHSYKEQNTVQQVSESVSGDGDDNERAQKMRPEKVVESSVAADEEKKEPEAVLFLAASAQQQDDDVVQGVEKVPSPSQQVSSPVNDEETTAADAVTGVAAAMTTAAETSPEMTTTIIDNQFSTPTNQFAPLNRDESGQTDVHYAAARTHTRKALLQILHEANADIACRDEFYRTPRDVAAFAKIYENVLAIDEYVFHTAVNGETDKILRWITDGYDHIFDLEYGEGNMMELVEKRGHVQMLTVLRTIPKFEEFRHELHNAIRYGTKFQVTEILNKCGQDAELLAKSRNYMYRCSLHIAVLVQKRDIIRFLIRKFPDTLLHVGDSLDRTPLHYAMALDSVEQLSNILIRAGANRLAKDLKGRQPSYYFINKDEILKIREEELS